MKWKFPWSFACLRHRRLLADTCEGCATRIARGSARPLQPLSPGQVPDPLRCRNARPGEIDSTAGRRDGLTNDVSRGVVATLLTRMDGFEPADNVLVIAATNRPDAIDPALRRPGRFDLEIPFDLPDERGREEILRAASRKQDDGDRLPHSAIAEKTDQWTPAELAGVWHAAARIAVKNGGEVDDEDYFVAYEQIEAQRRRKIEEQRRQRMAPAPPGAQAT